MADYMMESIEILERLANPQKPPLSLGELQKIQRAFVDPSSDKEELRRKLEGMAEAFQGRGDVSEWQYEILDAIDECFVDQYMKNDEILRSLFVPNDAANLNQFGAYCDAVDQQLRIKEKGRPRYAREYFAYFSIWQVQGYAFPVPLGTQSVVRAVNLLAKEFRLGLSEVSHSSERVWDGPAGRKCSYPRVGSVPIRGWEVFLSTGRKCSYPQVHPKHQSNLI